ATPTRPPVTMRCSATQKAVAIRQLVILRSLATPPATKTRLWGALPSIRTTAIKTPPSVIKRCSAIPLAPATRLPDLIRSSTTQPACGTPPMAIHRLVTTPRVPRILPLAFLPWWGLKVEITTQLLEKAPLRETQTEVKQ